MLWSALELGELSCWMVRSPGKDGPLVTVPSIRPPRLPEAPTVPEVPAALPPADCAVPRLLVPGVVETPELPEPAAEPALPLPDPPPPCAIAAGDAAKIASARMIEPIDPDMATSLSLSIACSWRSFLIRPCA